MSGILLDFNFITELLDATVVFTITDTTDDEKRPFSVLTMILSFNLLREREKI